ncbi:metal dependent phosphohydrolase [Natrialba chahannaoensis JCM 10990]|uniref:Metal dependent phosphohydrolase n=1 Tax=Natrialba chahannaoensis JCM 10990 TaxID=1227492 RepID=M0AZQ4_9EURY|nr:HD domain-containing protein [Natrialba chahannaoensis]ELZ02919.1 metal dependent phosphohydrolase [Natrialba chahannaoensis JCM 10990]
MLEEVRSRARPYFEDAPPAHDWHHVERVDALAETLVDRHPNSAEIDEQIVHLAVALHDIGRQREDRGEIDCHAMWGAREGSEILRELGVADETISAVSHCLCAHQYSNDIEPETVEARIVSDADNLDALGAVGIGRVFAHGTTIDSPMYDPAVPVADDDTPAGVSQYNHLHKKILDLPDRMYTDVASALAAERAQFVREFASRFEAEAVGER